MDTDNSQAAQPTGNAVKDVSNLLQADAAARAEEVEQEQPPETDVDENEKEVEEEEKPEGEGEGESDDESDESDDSDEGEAEDGEVDSIEVDPEQLSAMFGLDDGDVDVINGALQLKVKVDGKTELRPADEIIRNYQIRKHIDEKGATLNADREAFDNEMVTQRETVSNMQQQLEGMLNADYTALLDEYNRVDWNGLRAQNAAEFAATDADFNRRYNDIVNKRNAIMGQMQQAGEEAKKSQEKNFKAYVDKQQALLLDILPQWNDEKTARSESQAILQYAIDNGYSKEETQKMIDHRIWRDLRKAMLYDQGVTNIDGKKKLHKKKKVRVAKVSKGGVRKSASQIKSKNLEKQKAIATKSKDIKAKTDYVSNLISRR